MDESLVAGEDLNGESSTCQINVSLSQVQLEEKEVEDDEEEKQLRNLAEYQYQLFVLSQYGRPIFVSSGQEDKLCTLFALIGIFVSRVKEWGDSLESFSAGDVHVHFLHKPPLILGVVSKRPEWLASQLEVLFEQIVSTLSRTQLDSVYEKKGDNYDLRRLLRGTDRCMMNCVSTWRSDPALYLSAIRIFPLAASDREALSSHMSSSIGAAKLDGVIFGLVLAHRQLVSLVRFNKYLIHQKDVHILINLISNNQSLRNGETWTPICLPKFNDTGFLHAHISYPWEKTDACLILLSTRREHFFALSAVKADIVKRVESSPTLHSNLVKSLEKPFTFDITQIGTGHDLLWYFVYKNRRSQQMCLSGARIPFVSREERRTLNRSIASSSFVSNSNPIIRIAFVQRKNKSILIRSNDKFELICIFSPLVTPPIAAVLADKLLKQLKNSEPRYFISHSPSF
ncbi:hypothetical protein PFISCL1PPCAC_14900 [Pristionchus fissidentatus]|uniref:Vacuolar fusion protein MON1 homolog n=1 Tax=Pristionchus fissidentatus TaxID=1538716 RepID=A0AAV5VZ10_9BILA|nr:hypothetical protein PFISCL1PPCAC_14900 [Pristionchus fissidentatus]